MAHLVTDDSANGAVVSSIVHAGVEERRLEDGSREVDAVVTGGIESINHLRVAGKLGLVNLLAPLLFQVAATQGRYYLVVVGAQALALVYLHVLFHVLPLVRVTYIDAHAAQFLDGLGLGGRCHPRILLDALGKGILQVVYHVYYPLLATLGEVLGHIQFADRLAHEILDK